MVIGIGKSRKRKFIFENENRLEVGTINPYLLASATKIVTTSNRPISSIARMCYGNLPGDGNYLTLSRLDRDTLLRDAPNLRRLILPLLGAQELIRGLLRYCLWIDDDDLDLALSNSVVRKRIEGVRHTRATSKDSSYNMLSHRPHQFRDRNLADGVTILAPTICSETREYYPVAIFPGRTATTNQAYALYDAPLWNMALIASRTHLVWIATVCGKLKTDFRYSNTLGWNTFPVPPLTDQHKADLTRCAEDILLAREAHFPATIADLYDPEDMPENLRQAHERNDETLERIYIGRRFRNDTERLEKLFEMYTRMTAVQSTTAATTKVATKKISVGRRKKATA